MSINKMFTKYVSQNIFGMIGISLYILADTFFISRVEGSNGITALNLVLPIYSFIFAVGAMMGVGSAIRFKIGRAKGEESAERFFSNAIFFALLIGAVFMLVGGLFPSQLVAFLGGNDVIVQVGAPYTRIFMLFAPFFMWNHICNAFVRNDGAPTVAMAATLISSLFNIVMDYVLMFPLGMGMAGAALATALSPIIGILICCTHFFSKQNTVRFLWKRPSIKRLGKACQLGVAAFIGEFASGVTTLVFNGVILMIAGNVGVAAYGVIANTALVAISVFNGISQGSQPLLSDCYGKRDLVSVKKVLKLGVMTALVLAVLILIVVCVGAEAIVAVFNSDQNAQMAAYAAVGIRLYFVGFIFAGYNIVGTGYLSAINSAKWAFWASMTRGVIAIILCVVVLSLLFGMTGVWIAFPIAELMTAVITTTAIIKTK
ncbi:MAG: MATE family efflux transporter [Hespellia sp.]|nr:MATE family efflux transporter [Hespellia sp.]